MKFLIFHKFCSFWSSCVRTFFVYGRLHSREKKDWEREREKRKMFPHYITGGPTTQREEVLYEKEKFLNFIVCVCVFVCVCVCVCVCVFVTCFNRFEGGVGEEMTRGCVLTFLWGRLHREKKDWEREKENVLHHRPTTERRNIKRNKKLNF